MTYPTRNRIGSAAPGPPHGPRWRPVGHIWATSAPAAAETLDRRSRGARPGAARRRPCRASRTPSCAARGVGQLSTQPRGPSRRPPRTRRPAPRRGGSPWSRAAREPEIRHTEEGGWWATRPRLPGFEGRPSAPFDRQPMRWSTSTHRFLTCALVPASEGAASPRPSQTSAQAARAGSTEAQAATNKITRGVQGRRAAHSPITSAGSARNLERHHGAPPASARRERGGDVFSAIRHRVAERGRAPPGAFFDRRGATTTPLFTPFHFPTRKSTRGRM